MDIYRLIKLCGIVTIAWVIQTFGFSFYRTELRSGPPIFNVLPTDTWFEDSKDNRPLSEVCAERGWKLSRPFATAEQAKREFAEYRLRKLKYLAIGVFGAVLTFVTAWRFWESWLVALACVFLGPVAIAYGARQTSFDD